ncbi:ABC transporter substrate-binding protein [Frankia sp. QA3]|uniref:ABC transporter substrate-binding protein n=1 Tax=Frankia sp. QA3 TaxID=710111 RepID=UPI000269BDB0|nr:ABC transporter substrate-binding protein [Frankia sp. QA3]EIV91832.1 ABC-type nitrate/sulfonate/bicarbonate transport system, periplasmic component [Frankia sp. QA3]
MKRRRRPTIVAALVAALALTVAACGGGSSDSNPSGGTASAAASTSSDGSALPPIPAGTTLKVEDIGSKMWQILLAGAGLDKDLPYKIEWSLNAGGNAQALQLIQAGALDVTFGSAAPIADQLATVPAAGSTVVSGWDAQAAAVWIVASPRSGIKDLRGLKGRKVAVTRANVLEAHLGKALKEVGLTLDDVELVNLPPTQYIPAVSSGQVDATILPAQLFTAYRAANPNAVVLRDGKGLGTDQNYVVASKPALADPAKSAAIADLVVRLARGWEWRNAHRDAYVETYYVKGQRTTKADGEFLDGVTGTQHAVVFTPELIKKEQEYADFYLGLRDTPAKADLTPAFDSRFNAFVAAVPRS